MTASDKREEAFEKKFAHDEELKLRAKARRDYLLGLWAAEKLGLVGQAAENYSKDLGLADVEARDLVAKVRKNFAAYGVMQSEAQIRRIMTELMTRAIAEIRAGR